MSIIMEFVEEQWKGGSRGKEQLTIFHFQLMAKNSSPLNKFVLNVKIFEKQKDNIFFSLLRISLNVLDIINL